MNKIFTLCAVFLLVCFLPAQAQRKKWIDGYAILATKDTIKGEILYSWSNNPLNEIIFKQNNAEKKYLPFEIEAFGFADGTEFFQSASFEVEKRTSKNLQVIEKGSVATETKKGFVRMLAQGETNLYQFIDEYRAYLLIQKNNEEITVLKNYPYHTFNKDKIKVLVNADIYKSQLKEALAKAPKIQRFIPKLAYQESNIRYLLKQYHQEIGEKMQHKGTPNPIHIGATLGITMNKVVFYGSISNEVSVVDFPVYTTPTFGLSFEQYFDARRKRFSILVNTLWTGFKTNETLKSPKDIQAGASANLVRTWHYDFNIQHFKFDFLGRFNVPIRNQLIIPFIQIGMGYGFSTRKAQQSYYTMGSQTVYQKFEVGEKLAFIYGFGGKIKDFSLEMRFESNQFKSSPKGLDGFDSLNRGRQVAFIATYWLR